MTEAQWLDCIYPFALSKVLGAPSTRKCELFACACCRRAWSKLNDPRSRRVVEVAERFADGAALRWELLNAVGPAKAVGPVPHLLDSSPGFRVADYTAGTVALCCLAIADHTCDLDLHPGRLASCSDDVRAEWKAQCDLIRDIFGNPFRPVTADPVWLTSTVTALARVMYDSRDFSAMPILADALQDAGCDNEDVLNHCRGDGPHVRGCSAVDLILGRA